MKKLWIVLYIFLGLCLSPLSPLHAKDSTPAYIYAAMIESGYQKLIDDSKDVFISDVLKMEQKFATTPFKDYIKKDISPSEFHKICRLINEKLLWSTIYTDAIGRVKVGLKSSK